jgi:hypothetical protein
VFLMNRLVILMNHLVTLNWAGTNFGMIFVVQAGLFLSSGTIQNQLQFRGNKSTASPLVLSWSGHDWTIVQVASLAPKPMVILTFRILLLCTDHLPIHLFVIPVVWSSADGATAWTLGICWDLFLPVTDLTTMFFSISQPRHDSKPGA